MEKKEEIGLLRIVPFQVKISIAGDFDGFDGPAKVSEGQQSQRTRVEVWADEEELTWKMRTVLYCTYRASEGFICIRTAGKRRVEGNTDGSVASGGMR